MNRRILLANRLSKHKLAIGCNGITKRRTMSLHPCQRSSRFSHSALVRKINQENHEIQNKKLAAKIRAGIKRLKGEMAEISDEQRSIREGQRQVREKFEKIEAEWKETELITKQNAAIQVRLGLMSGILKARAQNDYELAAQLTRSLRDLMAKQKEEMH